MSVFELDVVAPFDVQRGFAELLRQTGTVTFETQHRAKDGRVVPVEIVANMIKFGDKEFNCCFVRDITERKRAEAALQESEEKYRSLVESAQDPIFTSDIDGRYLFVNTAAASMFGLTPDKIAGKSAHDLFPAHIAEEHLARVRQVFQTGKGLIAETESEINRQPYWFSTNLQPIHDRRGNVKTVQAVVRDISKLKQAEQALRQSEERLQQAVRVSHIGIFDHDHLTDTIYWSPEQRQNYGWGSEETVTLSKFLEQVYPKDGERIGEAVQRAHDPAGDGLFDVEHRIVRRDGAIRWLATRSQTFFEGERSARHPVRTVGAVLDVTESKLAEEAQAKLEEQLRQTQKLESIGQLAGGIAHDFNNLLVPIIGYAELGQVELSPSSNFYTDLEKIKTAAERAASLTRQLLAFSRRQVLEIRVFNLNEIITEFQEMLRRLITEDIEVQIFLASTPCLLQADRTQIEQILLNLTINAQDAMPNGGKFIIETENVFLDEAYVQKHSETQPGNCVMLSLSDTGHGMDTETQKHIFEPFFTTKEQGKGTGLGLATVFGIVKQHQGNIWVYSEPGKGTIFKIYLPRSEETTQFAAATIPESTSVYGTETVMVVEDEPMVRKLACETLEVYGYNVIEAESPDKGLQVASAYEGTIHLLLTDVIMPDMNGRELYEKLAIVRPDLKVLYMSGYTDNVIVHHGVLDEGVNFLQKPFTVRGLTQKVRRVLD